MKIPRTTDSTTKYTKTTKKKFLLKEIEVKKGFGTKILIFCEKLPFASMKNRFVLFVSFVVKNRSLA